MIHFFKAPPALFHTGWFVESLFTQVLVVYVIRTNKIPFLQSWPSPVLLLSTLGIALLGCVLPYFPIAKTLGFVPLPFLFFIILVAIALVYLVLVQIVKTLFTRKFGYE
jgi:Mg2+-importing ATPase